MVDSCSHSTSEGTCAWKQLIRHWYFQGDARVFGCILPCRRSIIPWASSCDCPIDLQGAAVFDALNFRGNPVPASW
jgi:hypothetical protein